MKVLYYGGVYKILVILTISSFLILLIYTFFLINFVALKTPINPFMEFPYSLGLVWSFSFNLVVLDFFKCLNELDPFLLHIKKS